MSKSRKGHGRIHFVIAAILLLSAILVPFPRDLPLAQAGSGPYLAALGTATVDGVISPGEYGSCISGTLTYGANVGFAFELCEANDAANLYLAFEVANTQNVLTDYLGIDFDNNHDGVIASCSSGTTEDDVGMTGTVPGTFSDGHYCHSTTGNPLVGGNDALQQGVGVRKMGGLGSVYEISHPLNSGDSNDFNLHFGDTVGWCLTYNQGYTSGGSFPNSPPNNCSGPLVSAGDASTFGNIIILAPAHSTTYTDTSTTTSTTSITLKTPSTGTTTTTSSLPFGATSTVTSTSASTTTVTIQADALTSTTTTLPVEMPVTSTTTVTVTTTTTPCNAVGGVVVCMTLTWTNSTTVTFVGKTTETVTVTQLIRTPTTFTNTVTMSTIVTSTLTVTGQYTTTITTTYTSPIKTTQTSTSTETYTSTITTIDTSGSGGGGFPGFPIESILMGLVLGAAVLALLRRLKRPTILE